ncbi:ribokinase [Sinomonas humi]|uniref:Ribokinase n=1 Tax=Sinomonas humi TaxID=1338436 RepID=A0A0B2AR61_9MICC|nr:ribokinase [Sinomonas humi]
MTVVGSINADIALRVAAHPLPGETVIGKSIAVHPGGKGANQAVAAARLGAHVAFVGAVGEDGYAEVATSGLREAGVDVTGIARVPGPTGQAFVTVDERTGENSIVVIPGANARVDSALIGTQSDLLRKSAVLVLQGEVPSEAATAAAAATRARLVLNLAPVIPLERQLILRADPLVVNEHEGRLALEVLGRAAEGLRTEESVLEALLEEGVRSVVITLGAAGAVFSEGDSVVRIPAPRVEPVDTTGAGDAFVGALSASLAGGASLSEAVAFAVRVGSYAVCRPGAQPSYPWRGDPLPERTA